MSFLHTDFIVPKLRSEVTIPNLRVTGALAVGGDIDTGEVAVTTYSTATGFEVAGTESSLDTVTGNSLRITQGGIGVAGDSHFANSIRIGEPLHVSTIRSVGDLVFTSNDPGSAMFMFDGIRSDLNTVEGNAFQLAGGLGVVGDSCFFSDVGIAGSLTTSQVNMIGVQFIHGALEGGSAIMDIFSYRIGRLVIVMGMPLEFTATAEANYIAANVVFPANKRPLGDVVGLVSPLNHAPPFREGEVVITAAGALSIRTAPYLTERPNFPLAHTRIEGWALAYVAA